MSPFIHSFARRHCAAIICAILAASCLSTRGQTTISGSLDLSDPVFWRTAEGSPPTNYSSPTVGNFVRFDVHPFRVPTAAVYTIEAKGDISGSGTLHDPFLIIYQGAFAPLLPLNNALVAGDDASYGYWDSLVKVSLYPGIQYFAVVTTYFNNEFGTYLLVFNPTLSLPPPDQPAPPVLVVDSAAIQSVFASGIPTALAQRELGLSASRTALRDFGGRLFKMRANAGPQAGGGESPVAQEEETVVMGEGDGEEAGAQPKEVVIRRAVPAGQRWEVFSSFDYGWLEVDAVGELRGLEQDVYAGHIGVEHALGRHGAVGLGVAGLESNGEVSGGAADTDVQGITLAGYVSGRWGGTYADVLYGASLLEHSISRRTGDGRATAEPNSVVHDVQVNLGHNFALGRIVTGPIIGAGYSHIDIEGYTEHGGARRVEVGEQDADSLVTRLGWQASRSTMTPWGRIIGQVRVAWERENFDGDDAVRVGLVDSPFLLVSATGARRVGGFATTASGHDRERSYLSAGAGVLVATNRGWSTILDYEGHFFDRDYHEHFASLRVSRRF